MELLNQNYHSSHKHYIRTYQVVINSESNARMCEKEEKRCGSINAQGTRKRSPGVGYLVAALTMEIPQENNTIVLNMVGVRGPGVMAW